MQQASEDAGGAAFVPLRAALALHGAGDGLELRAFGRESVDLDVEFDGSRAAAVTELLQACTCRAGGAPVERDLLWSLPVRARLHALVGVCLLTGWRDIELTLTCPREDCGEHVELELALAQLADAAQASAAREPREVAFGEERFRPVLPTGDDLRRWSARAPSDADLLAGLGGPRVAEDDAPVALLELVEAALAEVDPLVDVRVQASCPSCGQALEAGVDVEGAAIALLRRTSDELLHDVAALAAAFGWNEREILALPRRRRRRYRAMLTEAIA